MDDILSSFYALFKSYARCFNSDDARVSQNIELKVEHTYRVCKDIVEIAGSLGLCRDEIRLAEIIALFHDIGRFEQLAKYGTFSDRASEDHAALGLRILKSLDMLSGLSDRERNIAFRSIQLHNCYDLPAGEPEEFILYTRLIRDADKLDILGIVADYSEECHLHPNPAMRLDLPDLPGCSQIVVDDLLSNRLVKIGDLRTYNDLKLLYLGWAFDINFPYTLSCIREKRYMDRIVATLPDVDEVRRVYGHICSYIDDRLYSRT